MCCILTWSLNSVLLIFSIMLCKELRKSHAEICRPTTSYPMNTVIKDGDIMLSAFFRIHTSAPTQGLNFFLLMSMVFAINEINQNYFLLLNKSLGYMIFDECDSTTKLVDATLSILKNEIVNEFETKCSSRAIIGATSSTYSSIVVGYIATCKCLSNKKRFPSFLRTVPSDVLQSSAMAHLVSHFGWLYVGTVEDYDDYGKHGINQFLAEAEQEGLCIAFRKTLPRIGEKKRTRVLAKATVIVAFSGAREFSSLAEELLKQNITGKTWIASEDWATYHLLSAKEYVPIFIVSMIGNHIFGQRIEHVDSYIHFLWEFWEQAFNCTRHVKMDSNHICTGNEELDFDDTKFTDVSQPRVTYYTYLAIYTIAHALNDLSSCLIHHGPFHNHTCADITTFKPWQVRNSALMYKRTKDMVRFFLNSSQAFRFDKNGDPPAMYDVINWKENIIGGLEFDVVGIYDASTALSEQLLIFSKEIAWNYKNNEVPFSICTNSCTPGTRKAFRKGEPFCCFYCIPCKEKEFSNITDSQECHRCKKEFLSNEIHDKCVPMPEEFLAFSNPLACTLLAFDMLGIILAIVICKLMFLHQNRPVYGSTNFKIQSILLVVLAGCFLSNLLFVGRPSEAVCQWREAIASTLVILAISCLLQVIIFMHGNKTFNGTFKLKKFCQSNLWIIFCICPQIIICSGWVIFGHSSPSRNTNQRPGTVIIECSGASVAWPASSLAYLGLLTITCLRMALKAQKISAETNEAKFVSFSMIFCILIFASFILAYSTTYGQFAVAAEMVAVTAVGYGILCCMYFPTCYALLKNKHHQPFFQ
uniref:G-protein coupled receptors family 3 profile domain-containing protein n=1 Tax=Eptatretus burgeri TaxID=7764 RepID=A0A8C4QIA9_EPTBU